MGEQEKSPPKKKMQAKESKGKEDSAKDEKKAKWKQQHEQFMQAIKVSRKMKEVENNGGDAEQLRDLAKQLPA